MTARIKDDLAIRAFESSMNKYMQYVETGNFSVDQLKTQTDSKIETSNQDQIITENGESADQNQDQQPISQSLQNEINYLRWFHGFHKKFPKH